MVFSSAALSSLLLFLLLGGLSAVRLPAADPKEGEMLQPSLLLVVREGDGALSEQQRDGQRLVTASIEARFAAQRRYRLSRAVSTVDSGSFMDGDRRALENEVVLFLETRGNTAELLELNYTLSRSGSTVVSAVEEIPLGEDRFLAVDRVANILTDQVAALFPGFGRIRFTNTGYPHNYYVSANGYDLGANLDEIDLPSDTYEIVIRRRDGDFSQTVGRRSLTLGTDDFYEIVFSLSQAPPPVPGYMRLSNPGERWRAIFTLRGAGMIPLAGLEDQRAEEAWSVMGTALFGDVPFRGFVLGLESGYVRYRGLKDIDLDSSIPATENDVSELTLDVNTTPVLGQIGLTVGPVSGVDFIVRGGAGVAIYRVVERVEIRGGYPPFDYDNSSTNRYTRYDPAVNGAVEFGFGIGKRGRISLQTALLTIFTERDTVTWLQLGLGVGGRF